MSALMHLTPSERRILALLCDHNIQEIDCRARACRTDRKLLFFRDLHFAVLVTLGGVQFWRITAAGKRMLEALR